MEITKDQLENIISQTTETFVKHYESDIKCIQEKSNLSLWIIGLSIGMELFILNKLESKDLNSFGNLCLLISTGLIFIINSFLGLIVRIKQTRVYSHFLKIITLYYYQKTEIVLNLDDSTPLGKQIIHDFSEGIAINKIKDIEYKGEKQEKENPLIESDINFLHKSENISSTLLVIQAILTAIFLLNIL